MTTDTKFAFDLTHLPKHIGSLPASSAALHHACSPLRWDGEEQSCRGTSISAGSAHQVSTSSPHTGATRQGQVLQAASQSQHGNTRVNRAGIRAVQTFPHASHWGEQAHSWAQKCQGHIRALSWQHIWTPLPPQAEPQDRWYLLTGNLHWCACAAPKLQMASNEPHMEQELKECGPQARFPTALPAVPGWYLGQFPYCLQALNHSCRIYCLSTFSPIVGHSKSSPWPSPSA